MVAAADPEAGADQADADVPLPAEDDGAVDGGHEGDLHEREEDGRDAGEHLARVVRPQVGQAVHQGAGSHHLEKCNGTYKGLRIRRSRNFLAFSSSPKERVECYPCFSAPNPVTINRAMGTCL